MSVDSIAPFQSPLLLNPTNVLSEDFSHLFMDDTSMSIANIDLLTDDDHKALDATILTTFSANQQFNKEPHLPSLLGNIANNDRLTPLTTEEATKILDGDSLITTVLRNAWRKGAFKEVRQLGAYAVRFLSFL